MTGSFLAHKSNSHYCSSSAPIYENELRLKRTLSLLWEHFRFIITRCLLSLLPKRTWAKHMDGIMCVWHTSNILFSQNGLAKVAGKWLSLCVAWWQGKLCQQRIVIKGTKYKNRYLNYLAKLSIHHYGILWICEGKSWHIDKQYGILWSYYTLPLKGLGWVRFLFSFLRWP